MVIILKTCWPFNYTTFNFPISQVKHFISCPASLEEKYSMMRLADLLKRNKKVIDEDDNDMIHGNCHTDLQNDIENDCGDEGAN